MGLNFGTLCGSGFLVFLVFLLYALLTGSPSLRRYVLTRILLTLPMIFILVTLIFVVMRLLPGDPVRSRLKPGSDPARIEALKEELGLNDPIGVQYVNYLGDLLRGDFGRSANTNREVSAMIGEALPATLELILPSMVLVALFGIFSGAYAAHRRKSAADYSLRIFSVVIYAIPIFWLGLMFQLIFAVWLDWLPVAKRIDPQFVDLERYTNILLIDALIQGNFAALQNILTHMILPVSTLTLALIGVFVRLTRVNMLETLEEDFVTAGRARGIPENKVVYYHTLRNTLIPIVTLLGLQIAILMAGAILTETTFSWPGMGLLIREGIDNRDYPAVQGAVTVFAVLVALISLLTDILYAFIDPRIRY